MLRGRRRRTAAPGRSPGDAVIAAAAIATAVGAWLAVPGPWPATPLVAGSSLVVALWRGHMLVLLAACLVLSSSLAGTAWAAAAPRSVAPFDDVVTLRNDPTPVGSGVVADVVNAGRHLELRAFGPSARRLRSGRAGEQVAVVGRLRPPSRAFAARLRARHIVAVLTPTRLRVVGEGTMLARSANRLRQLLERGARTMTPLDRSLYLGFVIGDDRAQPRATIEDFRGSGLSHLTAVSGENVD